ncbi:MAG TPA: type II toxin-antitoxin system RelE/ParE family toxin [Sulfurovum sp.]|nr:MAG: plasmid stabilization protein [Sulfurovum sp. 35-42-20]OYZ25323.1 MAG: plasmid stabilization protein [Sulfurovum sp. 16-42-52]OYZ49073.1 MAG: plasmid stabilization protein [Sulfurovum sp. 24-42-9]OZA46840.1 MAG: plasmid stabilization protein [Sulfurovum sp. 17-42-90]OZA59183.1 MAG: plasmid stabilization protein [Sulfurovum sp. 39-42-12]HQR74758.1 type II toxin-antitoxin system RelE/ParE family toxin [Sulfurovum sp.]
MAYDIEYDPNAVKQLQKLNPTIAKELLDGIEAFANTPVITKIKKLKTPFDGAYRLRIEDYRVIFYQEGNLMLVSKIARRKEVY